MHLGVCHYMTLPGVWEDVLVQASELGCEGVEIFVQSPFTADLLDHPERAVSIREAARRVGVAIPSAALTYLRLEGLSLIDLDEPGRQRAVALGRLGIQRCAEMGGKLVLAWGSANLDAPAEWAAHVQSIKELAETGEQWGVRIAVETAYNAKHTLDLLESVGSPWVGDYFDFGNVTARGMDANHEARARAGHIFQVHVKGRLGAPLDAGTVDLAAASQTLREIGYDGWVMLETNRGDDPVREAERNLALFRRHFA